MYVTLIPGFVQMTSMGPITFCTCFSAVLDQGLVGHLHKSQKWAQTIILDLSTPTFFGSLDLGWIFFTGLSLCNNPYQHPASEHQRTLQLRPVANGCLSIQRLYQRHYMCYRLAALVSLAFNMCISEFPRPKLLNTFSLKYTSPPSLFFLSTTFPILLSLPKIYILSFMNCSVHTNQT